MSSPRPNTAPLASYDVPMGFQRPQNKLVEQVIRTPGRQPSPQPTHLDVPGVNHARVLQETGSGYVAPKFEGKEQQMEEGTNIPSRSPFLWS